MKDMYDGVRDNDATPGRINAKIILRIEPFPSLNMKIRRLKFSRGGRKNITDEYH